MFPEIFKAVVLRLECASEMPGGPVKTRIVGLRPQSFGFSRSGVGLKFPGDAIAAGVGTTHDT